MAQQRVSRRKTLVRERKTLELPPRGDLRIVVVADTHSRPDPRSADLIAAQHPDHILHAGDIGAREVLDALAVHAPVTAVRGNIDAQMPGIPDVVTLDVRDGDRTLVTMLLMHIAVYGPKLRADAARLARNAGASLVVCGTRTSPSSGATRGLPS